MDQGSEVRVSGQVTNDREEFLVDRHRGICDPFLSTGSVSGSKEKLWSYFSQGNDVLNVCKSFLYHFSLDKTLHFPEFAEWCAVNYSPSQRIIVSRSASKILCKIDASVVRENLSLPESYPVNRESINESVLAEFFKNCESESRCQFLSSILKEGQSLEGLFLPYPLHIFKAEVQLVMSLVCQVLGLDDDCRIGDVILGFLLKINSLSPES